MWETIAGTAPVPTSGPENTRTRLLGEISPSAAFVAFVSPGQSCRTAANTYDTASVPPVAGDDPVNGSDPSGLWTEGLCAEANVSAIASGLGGSLCAVESNGNQQVGILFTGGFGFSLSLNATRWAQFLKSPTVPNILKTFGLSGGLTVGYEISTAQTVAGLGGEFTAHTINLGVVLGGTGTYFTGSGPVTGIYLGAGFVRGASYSTYNTWTQVTLESGVAADAVAAVIDTYTQNPLNLPTRSALRGFLSLVAGDQSSNSCPGLG